MSCRGVAPTRRLSCSSHRPVLLAVLLATLALPVWPADEPQRDPETQLKVLRQRIDALRERMRETEGQRSVLSQELEAAEQRIGQLARRLRVLRARQARQQQRLDELEAQQKTQRQLLVRQRAALAEQIRAAYAVGRQERLKLLLNQDDPARLSRALTYYDYLNRARATRVAAIRRRLAELEDTGTEIARQELRLRDSHHELTREHAELVAAQGQRRGVLDRLADQLQNQGEQLAMLQKDEQAFEGLLRDIREALEDIPAGTPGQQRFEDRRGKLPWPSKGRLVADFGAPKIGSLRWDGVMISAPEGREVRAVHHGRVAFADWLRGFGLLLIVDHGDGWMTLYGHNQSLFKEAGDWVDENEPVALVGDSGGRKQPGVYFGIRHNGKPVNPRRWCRRARGRRVG